MSSMAEAFSDFIFIMISSFASLYFVSVLDMAFKKSLESLSAEVVAYDVARVNASALFIDAFLAFR